MDMHSSCFRPQAAHANGGLEAVNERLINIIDTRSMTGVYCLAYIFVRVQLIQYN